MTKAETEYIRDVALFDYDGECLCLACLNELKTEFQDSQPGEATR